MPAACHLNATDELAAFRVTGAVALPELQHLAQQVLADQDFPWDWPQVMDLRGVQMRSDPEALAEFAGFMTQVYRPRVRHAVALVMDGDAQDHIMAGLFRVACNMPATELFDDYGHALKWLLTQAPLRPGPEFDSAHYSTHLTQGLPPL